MAAITDDVIFRNATVQDCADLVLLADTASRGLTSYLWSLSANTGEAPSNVGRRIIAHDTRHFIHCSNWTLATIEGQTVGAFNIYTLPDPAVMPADAPEVVRPLNELKALLPGSAYISALALYPEWQGRGLGKVLLKEAANLSKKARSSRLALLVGSFNPKALALYESFGFTEQDRRPFVAFPGSDPSGDLILMTKAL